MLPRGLKRGLRRGLRIDHALIVAVLFVPVWVVAQQPAPSGISAPSAPNAALPSPQLPQIERARLGGLQLRDAQTLLTDFNRDVRVARRTVEAVQADVLTAGARANPTLGFGVSAINPSAGIGAGTLRDKTIDSFVRMDQLIERGGKRDLRIGTAKNLAQAAQADLDEVLRQQRLFLTSAYFDLVLAQDRLVVTKENVELFKRTIGAAEQRLKAGDIANADLTRIRVDALRAENDSRVAEADQVRARLAVATLMGIEVEAPYIRAADAWPARPVPRDAEIDTLVDKRPDVYAARARVDAAISARELARRLRTRDVSVGAQFDHYPANATNGLGSGNSFGMSVSIPLFWRYGFEGEIRRAEADYSSNLENLERVRGQARSELLRARDDLRSATERLQRFDESLLVEAKRSADFAEFAYRNGAIGVMDLLDARRVLRATQLDALLVRGEHAKALAAWQAAIDDPNETR